jgi:hypothetical protein
MVAPSYEVKSNGHKLLDEYRGDRVYGDCYVILKDGVEKYEVVLSELGNFCNCKAGEHGKDCKHLKMVYDVAFVSESD